MILVNHFIRDFRITIVLEYRSRLPLLQLKLFQVFSTGVWVWIADIWSNLIGALKRRICRPMLYTCICQISIIYHLGWEYIHLLSPFVDAFWAKFKHVRSCGRNAWRACRARSSSPSRVFPLFGETVSLLAIVLKAMNVTLGSKVNQDIMMAEIIVKRYCFRWTLIPS